MIAPVTTLERASVATGVPVAVLRGRCKRRDLCMIRWAVMSAMRGKGMSLAAIGRTMHRDHCTVHKGLRRAGELQGMASFVELVGAIG